MRSFEDRVEKGARDALLYGLIGAVIGGVVLGWLGVRDLRLASVSDAEPQAITCRELAERGPGGNAHVRMSGFRLVVESFAMEQTELDRQLSTPRVSMFGHLHGGDTWSRA